MHIILKKQTTPFCCESHLQCQQQAPSPDPLILLHLLTTSNFLLGSAWASYYHILPVLSYSSELKCSSFLSCLLCFPSSLAVIPVTSRFQKGTASTASWQANSSLIFLKVWPKVKLKKFTRIPVMTTTYSLAFLKKFTFLPTPLHFFFVCLISHKSKYENSSCGSTKRTSLVSVLRSAHDSIF